MIYHIQTNKSTITLFKSVPTSGNSVDPDPLALNMKLADMIRIHIFSYPSVLAYVLSAQKN